MTGDTWLILEPTSILALQDLDTALIDVVSDAMRQTLVDVYGSGGVFTPAAATFTVAGSAIDLDADFSAITGEGDRLEADSAADEWNAIPFANVGATVYYVGARMNRVPSRATANTIDGTPIYDREGEVIGEVGNPDSVSLPTATTLRLVITTLAAPGWTAAGTRPVRVWLDGAPETTSGEAIYVGTASYTGGQVRIDIPHVLGQSSPSTTAADYKVALLGPTIHTSTMAGDDAYVFLGTVTSGVWSDAGQVAITPWADLLALFQIEHKADGSHDEVHADSLTWNSAGTGKIGTLRITARELAAHVAGGGAQFKQNGGAAQQGQFVARVAATNPDYVSTTGGISGTWAETFVPANLPSDQDVVINTVEAAIWLQTAGATEYLQIDLVEGDPDSTAAWTTLASWTMTKPAAATWGAVTRASGTALPFSQPAAVGTKRSRYWRLVFAEPNPSNTRVGAVWFGLNASKVPAVQARG